MKRDRHTRQWAFPVADCDPRSVYNQSDCIQSENGSTSFYHRSDRLVNINLVFLKVQDLFNSLLTFVLDESSIIDKKTPIQTARRSSKEGRK